MRIYVVPHAGTWIEIPREVIKALVDAVVPHAGTWIEIALEVFTPEEKESRSPRGNVD